MELAARKAIRYLKGHDRKNVSKYIDNKSDKYGQMVVINENNGSGGQFGKEIQRRQGFAAKEPVVR